MTVHMRAADPTEVESLEKLLGRARERLAEVATHATEEVATDATDESDGGESDS